MKNSFYLCDSTEFDGHCETIMDYTLSWTLRRAEETFRNEKPILFQYSRKILAKLLGLPCTEELRFLEIKTWKQTSRIDLWVEVKLEIGNRKEKHAILVEDKYYTKLHNAMDENHVSRNQLEVYREKFDRYYDQTDGEFLRHYVLVTCIGRYDGKFALYEQAPEFGFQIIPLEELHDYTSPDSESDIFNEFWCRNW